MKARRPMPGGKCCAFSIFANEHSVFDLLQGTA
jgi:hypothetical protein